MGPTSFKYKHQQLSFSCKYFHWLRKTSELKSGFQRKKKCHHHPTPLLSPIPPLHNHYHHHYYQYHHFPCHLPPLHYHHPYQQQLGQVLQEGVIRVLWLVLTDEAQVRVVHLARVVRPAGVLYSTSVHLH